jgi:hypothetical protein
MEWLTFSRFSYRSVTHLRIPSKILVSAHKRWDVVRSSPPLRREYEAGAPTLMRASRDFGKQVSYFLSTTLDFVAGRMEIKIGVGRKRRDKPA